MTAAILYSIMIVGGTGVRGEEGGEGREKNGEKNQSGNDLANVLKGTY